MSSFAIPTGLPLPYVPSKGWSIDDYKEILNKDHSSLLSSDAIDNIRNIEYYYNNGKMSQLGKDFSITIPSNNVNEVVDKVILDESVILLMALKKGIGLYQTFTGGNIRNSDLLGTPPVADMSSGASYNRMIQENDDGTLSDSGMTLTSMKLTNMLSGYLASMGIQSKAGSMDEIAEKFITDNRGDSKFENWFAIDAGANSYLFNLVQADSNDTDAVNFFAPNYIVDKFGEWVLTNHDLFEGGSSEKIQPDLNTAYNTSNPLPVRALTDSDFVLNRPSDATQQTYWDTMETNLGESMSAIAANLYAYAYNNFVTAFNNNSTMTGRYGTFDAANFYQEVEFWFDPYNGNPRLDCRITFTPIYKNRTDDQGIEFTAYDDTNLNTGDIWTGGSTTVVTGQMSPFENKYWDTLTAFARRAWNGAIGDQSNTMGNPTKRQFGITLSTNYWLFDNLLTEGAANTNFNFDSGATPYDENSGTLSSFINGLTGISNFLNKTGVIDDDNKLWSYYIPNILNIANDTTTNTQAQQIAAKVKYKDIADDDEKQKETGMVLNPTGTAEKTKTNAREAADSIATTKDEALDIPLTDTAAEEMSNNQDLTTPILPAVSLPTVNANSFITAYNVSDGNLNAVGAKLWSADWLSILSALGTGDAISDAIISLNTVFSPVAPSDTSQPLKIAGIQIGSETAGKISARYSSVTLGYIRIRSFFNNFMDYECTFELYLPGIGYITIDNSLILNGMSSGGRVIRVDFNIDWYTGEGVYVVYTTRLNNGTYEKTGIIGCYSANCGSSIPVTNRNFNQLIGNLAGAIGGIITAPASGGASLLAAGSGIAGVLGGGGMAGNISTKGSYTANALAAGPKSIFIRRTKPYSVYNQDIKNLKNLPDYRAAYLANLKGTGLTNIDSNTLKGAFTCTAQEMDEIKSLLESGVIL